MQNSESVMRSVTEAVINALPNRTIDILEAGCGSLSRFKFPMATFITGIDISSEQLEKNTDLDQKVLGDIQDPSHFSKSFDLVVCWDVLEHIDRPEEAMRNFVGALRSNGVVVIKVPNILSMKGWFTKVTPHWIHVFVYKRILGKPDAGMAGCAPFPTTMRPIIAPPEMRQYLAGVGLREVFTAQFDALPQAVRESVFLRTSYYFAAGLLKVFTLGKYGGRNNTDFVCVYSKEAVA